MTEGLETQAFALFLMFCRFGGCALFAPGLASPRLPMHVRILAAAAATAALSPLLVQEFTAALAPLATEQRLLLILKETLIGSCIGLMARIFILALQFAATAISAFIGLSGIPGAALEEADTGSPLATLVSAAAVMLIMMAGLHTEMLRAILETYRVMPLTAPLPIDALFASLLRTTGETWLLALRLAGPFLLYGVVVNFALGLGNRFAQQISMYHATTGVVILGGFLLFSTIWRDWILLFLGTYRNWLAEGGF